jgi:hypothetical protein
MPRAARRGGGGRAAATALLCAAAALLEAPRPASARGPHTLAQLPLTHIVTDPLARAPAGGHHPSAPPQTHKADARISAFCIFSASAGCVQ